MISCTPSLPTEDAASVTLFDAPLEVSTVDASTADVPDAESPRNEVISVATDGAIGNADSVFAAISRDQRFVVFGSESTNLAQGDTNGVRDIFLRDRTSHTTSRISVGPLGVQGDGLSNDPSISDDGRYVAFASKASNFATKDANGTWDVFLLDRQENRLSCLSCNGAGTTPDKQSLQARISGDGRFVVFQSDAVLTSDDGNTSADVYLYERATQKLSLITKGMGKSASNGASQYPSISRTGDLIAFDSFASNLVPDDTNGERDVFVYDAAAQAITRASVASNGTQGDYLSNTPALAADAKVIAFTSWSHTFKAPMIHNLDVFARDLSAGKTDRMSESAFGTQGDQASWYPAVSTNGRFVAFDSTAENLAVPKPDGLLHVYVRDRETNTITRVASTGDKFNVSFVKFTDDASAILLGTSDPTRAPGGKRQIVWLRWQ